MEKYIAPFMEQFVDGQILLNDITANNLVSDLEVKSIHSKKFMREIGKLRSIAVAPTVHGAITLEMSECLTLCNIDSFHSVEVEELRTQTDQLKNDLSATRVRLQKLQNEYEELQKSTKDRRRNLSTGSNLSDGLTPESSAYHSDATTLTVKSGRMPRHHLREESNVTARTAYSEGNDISGQQNNTDIPLPATPPVPQEAVSPQWARYIEHLKAKNKRTNKLWLRADTHLQRMMKNYYKSKEEIEALQTLNQERTRKIDKLNDRIERRNHTIKKLKDQIGVSSLTHTRSASGSSAQFGSLTSATSLAASALSGIFGGCYEMVPCYI